MSFEGHYTDVAKRLFPPTPEKVATKRNPLHYRFWNPNKHSSFTTGLFGAFIFLLLCVSVVAVTAKLNSGWTEITLEGTHTHLSL